MLKRLLGADRIPSCAETCWQIFNEDGGGDGVFGASIYGTKCRMD
jgi:hypothetical protein